MAMVFSGAAGSWVFCASAVDNNRTKKIGRMAMRRSISGSFIFVKTSMNTPAGQFCATVDSSAPCPRLPSAFPHSFDRLTPDQHDSGHDCFSTHSDVNYLPRTKPARKRSARVPENPQMLASSRAVGHVYGTGQLATGCQLPETTESNPRRHQLNPVAPSLHTESRLGCRRRFARAMFCFYRVLSLRPFGVRIALLLPLSTTSTVLSFAEDTPSISSRYWSFVLRAVGVIGNSQRDVQHIVVNLGIAADKILVS